MTDATFDPVAEGYDDQFSNTIIGKLQRSTVWKFLNKDLDERNLEILEINCGTGIDAHWLSEKGHSVVATDVSSNMIKVAKAKFPKVKFQVCGFNDIESSFKSNSFDVVLSNFAGLNCIDESELKKVQKSIAEVLKPHGKFIGVFLGKDTWMEQFYFWIKGKNELIYRRKTQAVANLDDVSSQSVWCYSVREIDAITSCFSVNSVRSVGLFIPPSYLEPMMKRSKILLHTLFGLEILFGGRRFGADRSDHIYISFSKN
jgi:ubiquinone/menaquinone biosynthesis C-methylase UbiE